MMDKERQQNSVEPDGESCQVERLVIDPLLPFLTHIYNAGYNDGHNDTVEGCYTYIYPVDMETYQDDFVAELVKDILGL